MAVVELLVLAARCPASAAAGRRCARRGPGCARRACPASMKISFIRRSASAWVATISTGSQAFQRRQTVQSISPVSRSNGSAMPFARPGSGEYAPASASTMMVVKSAPSFFSFASKWRRKPATPAVASQRPRRHRQVGQRRQLEVHVARVAGDGGEQLGVAHREHERAEAAGRLAADGARVARRDGAEARVDRRDHLTHDVRLVVPDRGRIEVLRAAPAGEAVGRDDDRLAHRARCRQPIEAVAEAGLPRASPRTASRPSPRSRTASRSPGNGDRSRSRTTAATRPRSAVPSRRRAGCRRARGCRRSRRRCSSRVGRARDRARR